MTAEDDDSLTSGCPTCGGPFDGMASADPSDEHRFIVALGDPPPAVVLGVETNELAHNRVLHRLLEGDRGVTFLRALLAPCLGEMPELGAIVTAETFEIRAKYQPPAGGGRADEIVTVIVNGVSIAEVVIELKVEAVEDLQQLWAYMESRGDALPVFGLLLVVAERDHEANGAVAVMGARDIARALAEAGRAEASPESWRVANDWRRTVEFLALRDRLLVHHALGERVRTGDPPVAPALGGWWSENWRWGHERLAREIQRRLVQAGRSAASTYADPNGSSVDLGITGPEGLPAGSTLFVKWRLGVGFEVYVGAWDAANPRAAVQELRDRFRPVLAEALRPFGDTRVHNRPGASGALIRIPDESLDPDHIMRRFDRMLVATEAALGCGA